MTTKQRRFVEEYCTDFNATQAAIRAGYSERTARAIGSENLSKHYIRQAVADRLDELSMTAGEVTKRLTDWGRGTVEPFLTFDERGQASIVLGTAAARRNLYLIRKVKQTERLLQGEDGEDLRLLERRTEIELHDAKDAVVQIGKLRGMYVDRQESTEVDLTMFNLTGLERIASGEPPMQVLLSGKRVLNPDHPSAKAFNDGST